MTRLLLFAICGFCLTYLGFTFHPTPGQKEWREAKVQGLGLNHWVKVPPEGMTIENFLRSYPPPESAAALNLSGSSFSRGLPLRIDFQHGDISGMKELRSFRIDPGMLVSYTNAAGFPFHVDQVLDLRKAEPEEAKEELRRIGWIKD